MLEERIVLGFIGLMSIAAVISALGLVLFAPWVALILGGVIVCAYLRDWIT